MPVEANFQQLSIIRARLNTTNFTQGLLEGAKDIVDLASQLAPRDTGVLADSGKAEIVGDGKVEVSFGNDIEDDRAIAQEYGTSVMPAQPYLLPAIRNVDILLHVKEQLQL